MLRESEEEAAEAAAAAKVQHCSGLKQLGIGGRCSSHAVWVPHALDGVTPFMGTYGLR